jgi:hypothetical protein
MIQSMVLSILILSYKNIFIDNLFLCYIILIFHFMLSKNKYIIYKCLIIENLHLQQNLTILEE